MFDEQDRQYFYNEFKSNGYEVGSYDDFKKDLNNKEDRDWYYNEAKNMGYDVGTQADFDKMVLEPAASAPSGGSKQAVASAHASAEAKPQVAQPVAKPKTEYPQEVLDAYNSPDNKPGNFKDLAQLNDEYQRGELKKPSLISQALGMFSNVDAGNIGREQKVGGMIANMLLGDNMQQPQQTQQPQDNNQQVQQPAQQDASPESKEETPVTAPTSVVNNEGLMDAKLANYLENWKQRPDKQGTYFENMVADLLADGTANSNEEAVQIVQSALVRYANRSAMDVTNQVVASLPDDTVQDAEKSIEAQWYSHGVQDKLKQEADSMGISYDDYVGQFLKPAMVQSLVNKYGSNYRNIAEGIATRLYSHDENVQDRLMNQDINDALSSVINKYVNPSVVDEYNKAQEAGSKAFTEGMEGSQFIPANLRLGTALGAQYEANEAKDPAKVLSGLQKKFGKLYRNPEFLNDMSNAAFKVMQRYGLNGSMSGDPKQFKPMINSVLKNELDQLEIKGMMPKGSAEYIMKTGLGNTIVGKITRKAVQTDYQNWLEDMANQQYQPGFWENVASGALTFAGDAWSYWLPGAAGGKLTKSMIAKAEGKLAGDLMAKGMERKVAERAAKVLIGKSKDVALKNGAVHGAVTFGGQSAISKPIDEIYRTGQFDENGKIYNPSVGKIIANTLGEVTKQTAVGAIMQGGTIANMIGKGRGLATNILADVGGKVVDSGIMTGHQMLERMAQDPNFKPTGKDAAESFLESMANLTAIGLPGMVGKYARFKDAREFNKKFDFTDQDIAELKRFGYDGLRDAFEKVGIGEYAVEGENAQRLDGQLTQKYMDLMNDKSVPEVLKAKMMAVVEGKRPSSFSPVVDSIIVQPMDNDGKVYLETLNKDGGIIDRQEYSSLAEAQKADKKLEYEKTLGLASVLEGEFHNEFTQEHLDGLYNKAAQKYNMGEKLTDEDKAAVYLHQNAGAIKEIMDKQQKGIILTDEEQKQVDAYRHYYDSALENSSVMREFVNTFEDSHGVERGTLRKALESKDKKYAPLVESYLKELYNSIELKREMKQTVDDLYNTAHGNEQKRIEQSGVEGEKPAAPVEGSVGGQESPVSSGPAPYQDRTNSVPSPSDANSAANLANSSAEVPPTEPQTLPVEGETASNESKSDAYLMGQNAYQKGDAEGLKSIDHNDDVSKSRLKRAFGGDEAQMNVVVKAYEDGKDMEQFVAQRANSLTPAQQDAVRKYVEAQDAKNGVYDALQHADDGYGEALKEQLWPYQTEDGNIVPATLTTGQQVFLKKANEYGGGFVVVPDEQGQPTVKQVSSADIKEVGTPVPMDDYINQKFAEKVDARYKQFRSQFDGSGFKRGDVVSVSMEAGDEPSDVKIVGYTEDGRVILTDTDVDVNSQIDPNKLEVVTKDEFNAWRQNALDASIGAELDAEDAQRANDDAAKAEAEKKQRFANGIVGLSDQKPDYSSKETDPKVAAEYLQEQYSDNHDQLIKLVNGSRSDIKEQIDNIRKRIVEAEDWLDTNVDLEPEQAQSREDKLKLAKEQLEDLTTRYDNWNKIRSLIMTEEEKRELKDERTANIKKVGIDKEALTVTDEREVPVLTDEELKKQYPAMDDASDYILSQRKEIYKTQEELHRQLEDIDARLNQYLRGEADLTDEEIRDFNTTKADLEARQANLTESAKELKAQADKLKKLYVQENKKERAAILAEMTPAEQRKVKAEQYLKDGNIAGLSNLYADTSVDFTDSNPNTVDEYVASSIGRHALNFEGREVNGTFLNGLQQELGGTRKDLEKIQVLATEGKGQTFNKYVHDLYENLPDNLRNQGVNTQEIRNSLLELLRGANKYSDLKNYILKDKIAKAEGEMHSMDLAEEEQRAVYEEEMKENTSVQDNQIINDGDGGTDNMGNLLNSDGSIYTETVKSLEDIKDDEFEVPTRSVELPSIPQNVNDAIGANGKPVIIKKNIFEKNATNHPELDAADSRAILSNALYSPNLVGQTQPVKRPSYKVAVNTGDKNSIVVLDVYNDKKQVEIVGWRLINEKGLAKMQRQAEREGGQFLILSPNDGSAAALSALPLDLSSDGKDTNNSDNLQEKGKKFSEKLQNAISETETNPTEAQKKAGNYKKGHLSFGGYDFTVETPKGVTRSGKDEQGKPWSVTMHDTYGYILGKIGVDGDHIDMFINDAADLDTFDGNVCVVDQVNPETGEFDEHKVMYGYPDEAAATKAYLSNYSKGWKGLGKVTSVPKATFDKWLESSDRKTKPFRDYAMIQHEEAKKAKEANEALPFDVPMNMDNLPFHRDVKEVEPSDMTEAQKVAYDAVSTMLKKAGIPVKVVSNEDMEKVAEAQDNLNLAMLLNQPEMRFKIKTPEEKQAAENAYNFAKELRPDKWKQYAVVDMSNPNKMPEYFEKQELARQERSYYNKLMWGNYKVFNLDKSFEDNVAGLTGSFPSEFDPYKIDAQTSKKNELKKQMKETEEAYKLTGQERKEYQNQLMKEYMDEHGLASEHDIPDDVWREFDYKAVEKYQDKLDSLFAKYKDLDRQLKAVAEPGVQYLKGKGVVYGYTDGKEIVLNQEHLNANTPIHEYQHLWRTAAKKMNPELIEHGDKLIMQTQLFADLKEDPNYKHLSDDEICDEAFARLTGEDGAAILEQMANDAIKENPLDTAKELTIINRLKNWLKKFWYWTLDTFTKWKPEDIKKMTLEDIRNLVLRDLANGVDPRNVKSRMTKEDAVSLRKQMEDNAEQERILEHTEENWQKEFGKDSRVTTPIGSIKLGENQYKKAGRNDRIKRFGLLKPTLERPDVILEKSAPKEGAERQTKYLFIKSFKKADGNKILNYESITVKQGEEEVAISAHQIDPSKVVKELTESRVLWNRFRGDSNSLGENQGSALTPSANNPSGKDSVLNPHSDAKIRNNIETAKGNGGNLSVEDKIKAVSQQFGVDEADVAMYANAVKKGSTAEAARARANIKRHLLQANEDKISSFKELLKYTVPVNEALKENFGDVDAMIEERKQQMEAQRNAMEAARKRAEEEEAKRQKHLEELSLIPDDQLDKQYMDALAKGDDATAREMLDEAARRKGYDDTESAYQGVGAWAAPGNPGYESDKARRDDWESSGSDVNLEDMALGYTPQPDDYFSHPERYSQNTPHGLESVKAINAAIDAIKNGKKDVKVKVYRAVPTSVKEGKLRNGDWVTPSKKYAEMHGTNRLEGKYRIIEDEVPANQLWWDGNDANEFGFDDGKAYKYKNAKNNRKLNDLVTFDDEGDVIPPSKRFNSRKQDVRFHRVTEPEELERLNKEKTFRMYSGMQEVDGKLYSPMAAIIDGKRTDATEIGAWMRADERPDLVKNGKFQLVKTDKKPGAGEGPVRAAYNPYMHTSTSMMNDQFTGAYARGNIKVVEWEIPESEKTSGYHADGAKDAVGLVPWHSGSVNGLLPKDRQRSVMLSRWRKAVRVVPDSEVAESIAEQLDGTGLAIPWNVVTPNQLRELVKLGVPITTDESGQQAPETKEKFLAQMNELKKEFPQAQFVNVKMTKDAFKEWGGKNNVKLSLGDTVPFVREQRSINNAFNDALDKQIAGTLPKGYNYQLGKPSSALKFAGIEDLPIELSSRTLEVKSSKDYKSNHPFDLNSVKNLPVAIQRPVAIFDSEYEDGRKVILTELKDGKGHSIIAVLGLRKLRGRNYAEVNSIISLYGKDSSVRIAKWFDSKNPNGLGLDKNLCRWADTKKASEWLTNNASNVHSVGLSLKRIAKVINSFENNQFSEENLLLKHNFGDILGNSEGIAIENMRKIADSVVNTANKLGGAEATVYSSSDDVPEEYRSEVEQGAKGWYDPETHTVHVYLPNCADANEAERTVFHEKIGHEGMEVLLGGENEVRKFANFVYRSASKDVRGKIIDFANKYDPDWKKNDRMNVGTQEYIAHLAEEGPKTAEDFSLWTKIKHYLIKVLKKLGIRVPGLLNDKDLRYYLMKAGKALHVWDDMPQEKQEAMMKQASNAEIKDALSDGAGKGKPRQKKGESYIQYMKRAQEWRKWQNAREDKENPEPPMFYDIDKDEAGKKEWAQLNKDWRERHHLVGEEPTGMPIRMEGEEDDAYKNRKHEYEKWQAAMKDQEDPLPDMFAFEKEKQEEVKRKYEDWLAKHDLLEQQQADLDLYEGKIYPAETNPEADALEQQVMQDLAEVTSTDVSKEGAARSVHDAVIYRRKNIESASADDAIFINSVKQELNKIANASYLGRKADAIADVVKETVTGKSPKTQAKKMAEAIPYIIEAPRRMRDIADEMNAVGAFENGHIHVTAKDIDAIQPFTEELRNLASKNHKVEKDGKETIVYDDVPSMTEVASKMAKAINDNHVGEEGFVPVDGTDILAEHVLPVVLKRIVPQGIEYKNLSEEMQSLLDKIREWYDKTFTWLKDSHTVREDIGYTADYVNHRWDKEKSDDKAYADLIEGRQRTKSPNEKPRKVSTYMEGVDAGLVPKTTDITDLLAYYSQSNIEAFANKAFLQELSGINVIERNKDGEITSSMPLLSSIQPKEMMVDENKYTPYVVPGINTVWVYNQGKIFNKSAEDWFNSAFGTVKLSKILKGIKNAMSIAKTLELGFSGFHAGALTEVYAVQNSAEFGPAKAMAYFMKYLIADTAKNHQLPTFANPEVFKEAAKHLVKFGSASDYATADIENLYDKVHSYVARLHSKLVEGNVAMKAGSSVTFPLEVATELLKMSQKGLDVALWSYLHDGLKLATYQLRAERTRERAKKLNWDEDMLNKALDEDGQFVNDMFGGQHFDVLGISKKMQTILDFIFLSKDWLISTTRHALSIFGYGSIWNEASIKNFMEYYKHVLGRGEMTKEDYLRFSRSKSGLLCYGIGFMIGYEGLSQLVNAAMRAWDEEKQKEKADEIRKTNPSYKSPYELAYPNGMHWYDYLMRGNSLGQQSKIFMGRYADGTEMYIRHGKQFREIPELFFDAKDNFAIPGPMVRRMYGKASPLLRGMIDTYKWYLSPDYGDKEMQRKYGENLGLIPKLGSYYVPFAVPTQKDKEFKMLDLVFPSSKGFSRYKAQDYFKTFIMSEDKQGLAMTYNACVQNGIDPEVQLKAAISSVKALEASEMSDGVTSLQEASKRFDAAKSITEKKKMRQKMKKFLSQSEYKAFTQKEALDMVQGYLNGDEDLKEMEKAESKYLMKAKAEDVTEDWRIQNVWNGTMETYQEYQRLKDIDKAKANAFKNSKTNKRLFAARKAISAAKKKMNKAKKQMDGQNDAAKLVEIRKTRKELLETLNGME